MIPQVLTAEGELTAPKFAAAFAAGCGGRVVREYAGGPWAGFGSPMTWNGLMDARRAGEDFYYGDHGYFGRGKFYRVTKNAFQHDGRGDGSMARLRRFHESMKPWRKDGGAVIVCVQSDSYHHRMGWDGDSWLQSVLKRLSMATDRKIIIRDKRANIPLTVALERAWCVVTHASNSAVESIIHGVPAICTGDCAASRMSGTDPLNVEYPFYPDGRMEWAAALARNQWTLDEIRNGTCWKAIQ